MRERFEKLGAKKFGPTIHGCNNVITIYKGTKHGIDYKVVFDFTRHMGDITRLLLDRDDFESMAALVRFYRDLKYQTTHRRFNEK